MMKQPAVTVHARIDDKIFKHFALFDAFRLRRRHRGPLLFAAIMAVFAVLCFLSRKDGSLLIGSVLAIIGVGMPVVYIGSYFMQLNTQVKKLKLKKPQLFYTVTLADQVTIHNERKTEADVTLTWDQVFGVWRGKDAFYLYMAANKAFLLPDGCCELEPAALWQWLGTRLPKEKLHGKTL